MKGLDPAVLEETRQRMAAKAAEDKRPIICACGHPLGKHTAVNGKGLCNALKATCPCTDRVGVLKAPNARIFSYRTDEQGHAIIKGVAKTYEIEMGHRIEWIIELVCMEEGCGSTDRVTFVPVNGGRSQMLKCGEHR